MVAFLGVYIFANDYEYADGCALHPVLGFDVGERREDGRWATREMKMRMGRKGLGDVSLTD